MINLGIRVVLVNLPTSVKSFVYYDSTATPVIVLNARLTFEIQKQAFDHEVNHILRGDMDNKSYKEYPA